MARFSLFLFMLVVCCFDLQAVQGDDYVPYNEVDGFTPVGKPLIGVPTQDFYSSFFGTTVSISSYAGDRMVIGAPTHGYSTPVADDTRVNEDGGAIFLYEFDQDTQSWRLVWFLAGMQGEGLGNAVAISGNGSRIAIRRRLSRGPAADFVEVYEVRDQRVVRLGVPIGCVGGGMGLAFAPTGQRIAVSCESFDNGRGRVEVYDYENETWVPTSVFIGLDPGDIFGWGTSFSSDGARLAISAPSYSFKNRDRCGMVQVFETKDGKSWVQVGGTLIGSKASDAFGLSMALSGDGRTIVVGSPGSNSNKMSRSGEVKAFFNFRGIWLQTGSSIAGVTVGDEFGEAVSVSFNGARIAASSSNHASAAGHIRFFDLKRGEWKQHGDDIVGFEGGTRLGYGRYSVSLDGRGRRLAYGSPFCGLTGCAHVVAYTERFQYYSSVQSTSSFTPPSQTSSIGNLDWDIQFIAASINFSDEQPASIMLMYEINSRTNSFTVYEPDCMKPVARSLIMVQATTQTESSTTEKLFIDMSISLANLFGSPIYAEPESGTGRLSLCVRVDLFNEAMVSVAFDQRYLAIELDTSKRFEVLDIKVDDPEVVMDVDVQVDYKVKACQCDESFACIDEPVDVDLDTVICVKTDTEAVRVSSITQLQFFKGSLSQTAVREGETDDLTLVTVHGDLLVIRVRLVSAFFEGEGNMGIHARGVCTLSLIPDTNKYGGTRALREFSENLGLSPRSGFAIDLRIKSTTSTSPEISGLGSVVFAVLMGVVLLK